MKFSFQGIFNARGKQSFESIHLKSLPITRSLAHLKDRSAGFFQNGKLKDIQASVPLLLGRVGSLGYAENMDDFERRKLKVFNLLNFFQLAFGIIIPVIAVMGSHRMSSMVWFTASMPALVSVLVLWLNSRREYEISTLCYFILYPVITSIVYLSGMNLGIELCFILYGILAVFFIQNIGHMAFTVCLSMISYFIITVVWRNFQFHLEVNSTLFLINHLIGIIFIFCGLFLIKKENADYHLSILDHNRALQEKHIEIEKQKQEIAEKAELLNKQAGELRELNALKNKLFSVIAHDLKSPVYALRNMFINIERFDPPAEEVKAMVPDMVNDLNYTTSLIDNLLQWSKSQMQMVALKVEEINIAGVAEETMHLFKTQANTKKIRLENTINTEVRLFAQCDMIRLVLRNLISNAIKFTPVKGFVRIGTIDHQEMIEVYVEDSGIGIGSEALEKIGLNNYYTTPGTAKEAGTGLGLMLCKEFICKNGGELHISSIAGKGSRFSFSLKKANRKK